MLIPPALVRVVTRRWDLWLPFFLLWPLLVMLFALVFFVALLAVAVTTPGAVMKVPSLVGQLYRVVCEIRGTSITVEAPRHSLVVVTLH